MLSLLFTSLIATNTFSNTASASSSCPKDIVSCRDTATSGSIDSCCVPSPAGIFVFKQRFEPDVEAEAGKWGIDGLEVLNCDQTPATTAHAPKYEHEEIASFCLRSPSFGGDVGFGKAENEWAQSEVGEGVEEVWARSWNTAGRYISTCSPECNDDKEAGVAGFFHALSQLHAQLPIYSILTEADITPSTDTTYSLDGIVEALAERTGYKPVVSALVRSGPEGLTVQIICDNTTLSSVYWPFQVKNAFSEALFESYPDYTAESNCPKEGIVYPSIQTIPPPLATATWDDLRRPTPRPITMSHDESRMYYTEDRPGREDPRKLGLFKAGDEEREERKNNMPQKKYIRDEL